MSAHRAASAARGYATYIDGKMSVITFKCNSSMYSRPDSVQLWSNTAQTFIALNICHPMAPSISKISSSHAKSSPKMSTADGISALLTKKVAWELHKSPWLVSYPGWKRRSSSTQIQFPKYYWYCCLHSKKVFCWTVHNFSCAYRKCYF